MKILKTLFITAILIQGAINFSSASEKKNESIIKEIKATNLNNLLGSK